MASAQASVTKTFTLHLTEQEAYFLLCLTQNQLFQGQDHPERASIFDALHKVYDRQGAPPIRSSADEEPPF